MDYNQLVDSTNRIENNQKETNKKTFIAKASAIQAEADLHFIEARLAAEKELQKKAGEYRARPDTSFQAVQQPTVVPVAAVAPSVQSQFSINSSLLDEICDAIDDLVAREAWKRIFKHVGSPESLIANASQAANAPVANPRANSVQVLPAAASAPTSTSKSAPKKVNVEAPREYKVPRPSETVEDERSFLTLVYVLTALDAVEGKVSLSNAEQESVRASKPQVAQTIVKAIKLYEQKCKLFDPVSLSDHPNAFHNEQKPYDRQPISVGLSPKII